MDRKSRGRNLDHLDAHSSFHSMNQKEENVLCLSRRVQSFYQRQAALPPLNTGLSLACPVAAASNVEQSRIKILKTLQANEHAAATVIFFPRIPDLYGKIMLGVAWHGIKRFQNIRHSAAIPPGIPPVGGDPQDDFCGLVSKHLAAQMRKKSIQYSILLHSVLTWFVNV